MPLTKGYSSKSIGKNIKMEKKAGKPSKAPIALYAGLLKQNPGFSGLYYLSFDV